MKKYRHYKGGEYELMCVATHSETDEKLVIYKNNKGEIFARPFDMFFEQIEYQGSIVPRFREIR
jgi:hypothetical protein